VQSINVIPGVPNTPSCAVKNFSEADPIFPDRNLRITGVTYDASGNRLGSCTVEVFETDTNQCVDKQVSDGSGNYMVQIPVGLNQTQTATWYIVAYLAGSPDVAGTTVNTLTGA
jgi:hypothetical protein